MSILTPPHTPRVFPSHIHHLNGLGANTEKALAHGPDGPGMGQGWARDGQGAMPGTRGFGIPFGIFGDMRLEESVDIFQDSTGLPVKTQVFWGLIWAGGEHAT